MVFSCLPNHTKTMNQQRYAEEELHAFDLTWRNYIPSPSQLCCCFSRRGIRLEDTDPLIEPPYYNDHTLYRGEALQNYLDNPRDSEFESVLGQNDLPPFVTRNPFGTASLKKKKSGKRKKNRQKPIVMETDREDGDILGYDIMDTQHYHHDAEYIGDDQINSLAYNRNSQNMDQYGEELYHTHHIQGPIEQEMHFRASYARTLPNLNPPSSSSQPLQEDTVITEQLVDLTEKLNYIKTNFIQMNDDTHESIKSVSDIDSVASEALDVYEHAQEEEEDTHPSTSRRYSSGDEFHIQSLASHTPFVSEQHPFTYLNESNDAEEAGPSKRKSNGMNVRNVFQFGRQWLGV